MLVGRVATRSRLGKRLVLDFAAELVALLGLLLLLVEDEGDNGNDDEDDDYGDDDASGAALGEAFAGLLGALGLGTLGEFVEDVIDGCHGVYFEFLRKCTWSYCSKLMIRSGFD